MQSFIESHHTSKSQEFHQQKKAGGVNSTGMEQTSDSLSTIWLFDHNAIVQHFVSEFPIQIMCISCNQDPAKAGILRERFYIGHQCRSKSSVLIGCVNYDITQIVRRGLVTDHSCKTDQLFFVIKIHAITRRIVHGLPDLFC